jgi:hypothetical protein
MPISAPPPLRKIISMDCQRIKKEVKLKYETVTRGLGCYYFFLFAFNVRG